MFAQRTEKMNSKLKLTRRRHCRSTGTHFGFTLIELLVVVSIIALLVSILLPTLNNARELALLAVCQANLKSVGTASMVYTNDWQGALPRGGLYNSNPYPTWRQQLNDYLGGGATVKITLPDASVTWTDAGPLVCPSAPEMLPANPTYPLLASYSYNVDIWDNPPGNDACNDALPAGKKVAEIARPAEVILAGDGWKNTPDWWYYGRGFYWLASSPYSPFDMNIGAYLETSHADEQTNILFTDTHVGTIKWSDLPELREGIWTIYAND